jgi:hypothetical protein|tara:strand:- start:196 stop:540 length:345 start_codon:yes stop_codon:yes gene_type:complete
MLDPIQIVDTSLASTPEFQKLSLKEKYSILAQVQANLGALMKATEKEALETNQAYVKKSHRYATTSKEFLMYHNELALEKLGTKFTAIRCPTEATQKANGCAKGFYPDRKITWR